MSRLSASLGAVRRSPRVRFALRFVALLSLLLWPWPGLGGAFASLVSAATNFAVSALWFGKPSFELRPEGPSSSFNAVMLFSSEQGHVQAVLWELRRTSYLPAAVFLALALAFPFGTWRRRVRTVVVGLPLLALLPGLRLLVLLEADTPLRAFELPSPLRALLTAACNVLVLSPGMAYALPGLLWLFLLRRLDEPAWRLAARELAARRATLPSAPFPEAALSLRFPASLVPEKRSRRRRRRARSPLLRSRESGT